MKAFKTALRAPVIIGPGRVGRSMAAAIGGFGSHLEPAAGSDRDKVELRGRADGLDGLAGRVVLLAVGDEEITPLAERIGKLEEPPELIGHTSGATSLQAIAAAHADGEFSVHPLQTVPDGSTDLTGCPAAVAGSTPEALEVAEQLAEAAGMSPFQVAEEDRAIYHAVASIASNFLVAIEQTAAELLTGIGVENPRQMLEPLIRRSLENWLARGPVALTGPIARGDTATVEAHRNALDQRRPDLIGLYDVLAERTRQIAAEGKRS